MVNVFSASYKGHNLVLSQPDQLSLKVFSDDDIEFMKIALIQPDDLVKSISVAKEMIDEITT